MVTLSKLLKNLSSDFDSKILDFGCGDGREMVWMRRNGFRNLTGFDVARWSTGAKEVECTIIEADSIGFLEKIRLSLT